MKQNYRPDFERSLVLQFETKAKAL